MKKKINNGITLIALVITIIILLILAGVTIGIATNGTGLFEKAKEATQKYQNAQINEETEIAKYSNQIYNYINGNREYKEWKKIGTATGSDIITFDASTYTELHIEAYSSSIESFMLSRTIFTENLSNTFVKLVDHYNNDYMIQLKINNSQCYITHGKNGTDIISTYTLALYGR